MVKEEDLFGESRILEHMYTRARKGLYSPYPGYDSVYKSPGLSDSLVKDTLQSLCFYNPPKNSEEKPDVLLFSTIGNKALCLTRSVFQPRDFTGERSAFFSHQIIFTGGYRDEILDDLSKGLYASPHMFQREFFGDEKEREDRGEIVVSLPSWLPADGNQYLEALGVPSEKKEELFQKLVFSLLYAEEKHGKIFLAFRGRPEQAAAKTLLTINLLGKVLPRSLRKDLTFISFTPHPVRIKGITIEGVEPGGMEGRLEYHDVSFDFVQGRFGENQGFLKEFNKGARYARFLCQYFCGDKAFLTLEDGVLALEEIREKKFFASALEQIAALDVKPVCGKRPFVVSMPLRYLQNKGEPKPEILRFFRRLLVGQFSVQKESLLEAYRKNKLWEAHHVKREDMLMFIEMIFETGK